MSFRGRYEYSLDTKGRLNIPAKFREIITQEYHSELVITTALDGCLDCYPLPIWTQVEEKLNTLPSSRNEVKRFKRFYISGAIECSLDKQGRVLLPPTLRNWAGLDQKDNNVVIAGQIDKLEFWSQERWGIETQATTGSPEDIRSIVEVLEELGVSI